MKKENKEIIAAIQEVIEELKLASDYAAYFSATVKEVFTAIAKSEDNQEVKTAAINGIKQIDEIIKGEQDASCYAIT